MTLHIIKIGGNIIDNEEALDGFVQHIASLKEPFILVHGGGKLATSLSARLGIETQLVDGRRITDAQTLDVVVMVYAGLINKKIVAKLQASGCNAIGLCGADGNIMPASRRVKQGIDYGFVGDVDATQFNAQQIHTLLQAQLTPVFAPITHDGKGCLLNTNADTIAAALAVSLAPFYEVQLHYCFEKNGVLENIADEDSVIPSINREKYEALKDAGIIAAGMIPKLDNAFHAITNGVRSVHIIHATQLLTLLNEKKHVGTILIG